MEMDHYAVLNLPGNAGADEIARAYRQALDELRHAAENGATGDWERLDALRTAWKVLGDPRRRAEYDELRGMATGPVATSDIDQPAIAMADGQAATKATPRTARTAARESGPRRLGFEFTGDGGEYFRIWIVNLVLSILTLGIYSAWAKVRREQYFHRNLRLDGTSFDYHGDPKAILKGRVIAVILLAALSVAEKLGPVAYGLAVLALVPVMPWLMVRALRFRAHNTSYSGLRFRFVGTTADAAKTLIGYWLAVIVSFGLALPLFLQRIQRFVLDNLRFGNAAFVCEVTAGRYYRIFIMPVLAFLVLVVALGVLAAMKVGPGIIVALAVGIFALSLLVRPYLAVAVGNAVWNATTVSGNRFESHMTLRGYFAIAIVNALLLVLTLGFFWPWAKVRMARYRAECMALNLDCAREDFLAGEAGDVTAAGEEVADLFDIDIGA